MATREYNVILSCDGQPLAPVAVRFDPTVLQRNALQRGLDVSQILAQQLQAELSARYTLAATEQELVTIARLLLESGSNRTRPLAVRRTAATSTPEREAERQRNELQTRLEHALTTLQFERGEHRRKREELERDLADTTTTLQEVQADRRRVAGDLQRLEAQLKRLEGVERSLQTTQANLNVVTGERDGLQRTVERYKEGLEDAQQERHAQEQVLATLHREYDQQTVQMQQLQQHVTLLQRADRLLGLALFQLIRVQGGFPLQIDAELAAILDDYRRRNTHAN